MYRWMDEWRHVDGVDMLTLHVSHHKQISYYCKHEPQQTEKGFNTCNVKGKRKLVKNSPHRKKFLPLKDFHK